MQLLTKEALAAGSTEAIEGSIITVFFFFFFFLHVRYEVMVGVIEIIYSLSLSSI